MTSAAPDTAATRLLLVTGKGGVGKTTLAAATAMVCADAGLDTCVASTDTAHSLGEVLATELDGTPRAVTDRLDAAHIDAREQLRVSWAAMEQYLRGLAERADIGGVRAGELATVPGLDDVLTLAAVVDLAEAGHHDVVVVDCAASAETIRLLSLPHVLGWWLERLLPTFPDLGPLTPLLEAGLGAALPGKDALAAGHALLGRLRRAEQILNDPDRTSVRLVTTPEQVVVAETRRTATYLSLFGYPIDAVVANRVLGEQHDAWWSGWYRDQQAQLERVRADVAPVPVLESPMLDGPAVGCDALVELGRGLYGDTDPMALARSEPVVRFEAADPSVGKPGDVLRVRLTGLERGDVRVRRRGGDLHLHLGPYQRVVALPDTLVGRGVGSARVLEGELWVEFEPIGGAG